MFSSGHMLAVCFLAVAAVHGPRASVRPRLRPRLTMLATPHITIAEAEPNFVDDENLEAGERLVSARKAFDDAGTLLCAGALLLRQSTSAGCEIHECWVADSLEPGVGPNVQLRGAQAVLDELFLLHLESTLTRFCLHVGSGRTSAATRAAALSRGFVVEATCEDTAESLLLFDESVGMERYQALAELEEDSAASRLVRLLCKPIATKRRSRHHGPSLVVRDDDALSETPTGPNQSSCVAGLVADLSSDDWQPLRPWPRYPWCNPCFASSFLTWLSVWAAWRHGLFVPFGIGPLLVLLSSIAYWQDPRKESRRRVVDLITVRTGLAVQVALTAICCKPAAAALWRLLLGYALGAFCYAAGRVLVVRGFAWTGHCVHCGVHIFANLGNLLVLSFATGV